MKKTRLIQLIEQYNEEKGYLFMPNGRQGMVAYLIDEDGFKGLLAMSSYHHVKDGVKYPAVLLTHGMNDPRVEPWMSAKMTARLQAATVSNKPILFRVEFGAGHGIGSTRNQYLEQLADQWAFLLWQFDKKIQIIKNK